MGVLKFMIDDSDHKYEFEKNRTILQRVIGYWRCLLFQIVLFVMAISKKL